MPTAQKVLPKFEGIEEKDGELVKVISIRVDNFTTIRRAVPVPEEEIKKIKGALQNKTDKDLELIKKHEKEQKPEVDAREGKPAEERIRKPRGKKGTRKAPKFEEDID